MSPAPSKYSSRTKGILNKKIGWDSIPTYRDSSINRKHNRIIKGFKKTELKKEGAG